MAARKPVMLKPADLERMKSDKNTSMDSKPIDPVLAEQRRQNAAAKEAETARLQADRAARVRERVQKADADEQRRLALDAAEANVRSEARAAALARANKLLWRETEPVKEFQSALQLSEVMAERQAQVAHKQRVAGAVARRDAAHAARVDAESALAAEGAAAEAAARRDAAKSLRAAREEQLAELAARLRLEQDERVAEGHRLRALAAEDAALAVEAQQARIARIAAANAATVVANEELLAIRAAERARESEADAAAEAYAAAKRAAEDERAARAEAATAAFNAARDAKAEETAGRLRAAAASSAARTDRNFEEARLAEDNREAVRARAARDAYDAMARFREQQVALKAAKAAHEAAEAETYAAACRRRDEMYRLEVAAARDAAAQRSKALQEAHLAQIEAKRRRAQEQAAEERAEAVAVQRMLLEDDAFIAAYQGASADAWRAAGKDMRPLLVHAAKKKSELLPTR